MFRVPDGGLTADDVHQRSRASKWIGRAAGSPSHPGPALPTEPRHAGRGVPSDIVLSEHKHAWQKPETQTSVETGTHSAENDNVILVIRTPTIRKIRTRPLSRQCPQESIGAAAVPDGVPAGKLEPKTVTETGASELASWRQTQTSAASVTSKHETGDAGRRGATQIFPRRSPGAAWLAATDECGGWPSRCSAVGIATEKCQNV